MRLPSALTLLLALALLWAGSLAPGVMPVRAADGSLVLELCTGEGVVLVRLEADGSFTPFEGDDGGGHGAPHDQPCAFAAAHVAVTPLQPLLWTLPDGTAVGSDRPLARVAPAPLDLALRDNLPRGPPAAA